MTDNDNANPEEHKTPTAGAETPETPDAPDFSRFEQFSTVATREFSYRAIQDKDGNIPVIIVANAAEHPEYKAEIITHLAKMASSQEKIKDLGADPAEDEVAALLTRIAAEKEDATRILDRELFPKYIMQGWKGVRELTGREIPFNPANAAELLSYLPDHIFDVMRKFVTQARNFEKRNLPTMEEAKQLGESSQSVSDTN